MTSLGQTLVQLKYDWLKEHIEYDVEDHARNPILLSRSLSENLGPRIAYAKHRGFVGEPSLPRCSSASCSACCAVLCCAVLCCAVLCCGGSCGSGEGWAASSRVDLIGWALLLAPAATPHAAGCELSCLLRLASPPQLKGLTADSCTPCCEVIVDWGVHLLLTPAMCLRGSLAPPSELLPGWKEGLAQLLWNDCTGNRDEGSGVM